jgi:hypothetical protein
VLLIRAAGHVVTEDATAIPLFVVADEERHDDKSLHGRAEVSPDHPGEAVRLAFQGQRTALHLLIVLELDLEQADELNPHTAGARVAHGGELVAAEDLLHIPLRDHASGGGPAVTGQHHPVLAHRGHDRRSVRQVADSLSGPPVGAQARYGPTGQQAR